MTGTSLHTKYRPKTLDEVVGHVEVVSSLKHVVEGRRSQTFLFTGPAGVGKTTFARILSNEFAGEGATVANIHEWNAAMNTGVDDVREITKHSTYRAVGKSPVKALIVDECHALSSNAWKALLKGTEEPPPHVYWFLCTTNVTKVPKTIFSRCVSYDLKPLTEDDITKILIIAIEGEKFDVSDAIIEAIAEASGGSARQALVYLEACIYCENVGEAKRIMRGAGLTKGIIDLCQYLIKGEAMSWANTMKLLDAIPNLEPESTRIVAMAYFSKAVRNTKGDGRVSRLLGIMEAFEHPFNPTDKEGPLLLALGRILKL